MAAATAAATTTTTSSSASSAATAASTGHHSGFFHGIGKGRGSGRGGIASEKLIARAEKGYLQRIRERNLTVDNCSIHAKSLSLAVAAGSNIPDSSKTVRNFSAEADVTLF